ncbi:MAG TPA: DNA-directed DNA polymerase II small subunit [Candidatus Acidoferrales bacterium]|nr:DNA-directed DNA polymerase II small subunit [Candidatus Acidoferrales bacterium]
MAGENVIKDLVSRLSRANILVAGDIRPDLVNELNSELILSRLLERYKNLEKLAIVNNEEIENIVKALDLEKAPMPIEIVQKTDFLPMASEVDARYTVTNNPIERAEGTVDDFVQHFKSRLQKMRRILETHRGAVTGVLPSVEALKTYTAGREVTLLGIVLNKIVTKNGNIMMVLEDETGEAKVMFMNGSSKQARSLFESAGNIVNDEVLAVRGKISGPFVIASDIIWPDVQLKERKSTEEDIAIAMISDTHVGSKLFMEKNFTHFVKWLNGDVSGKTALAGKIKYLVIGGDVVDGIGVYPRQDRDLSILDVYNQYKTFFNFIRAIPEYIHVFIIPGNHDAVQRAEPQPELTADLIGDFHMENVHLLPNPSFLTLHGVDLLAYHGTSLDSVIASIPNMSYANPEKAMLEMLKRRHLSPIYGGNIIVPSKNDNLVIEKIPDILQMGHVHKNGYASYHGVEIVNSGTWQARTDFQVMQGHIPTPCLMSVFETKTGNMSLVDFNREI